MGRWKPLVGLGIAQFLMVLDTAVMNVSISQLVHDFNTEVTTIQAVITLYALVMAALMITGGKLGDIWGRRRAFTIGMIIYAVGSGLTSVAPTVAVLALGGWAYKTWRDMRRAHPSYPAEATPRIPASETSSPS